MKTKENTNLTGDALARALRTSIRQHFAIDDSSRQLLPITQARLDGDNAIMLDIPPYASQDGDYIYFPATLKLCRKVITDLQAHPVIRQASLREPDDDASQLSMRFTVKPAPEEEIIASVEQITDIIRTEIQKAAKSGKALLEHLRAEGDPSFFRRQEQPDFSKHLTLLKPDDELEFKEWKQDRLADLRAAAPGALQIDWVDGCGVASVLDHPGLQTAIRLIEQAEERRR